MIVALLTGVVLVVTLLACVSDVRSMRIPNAYSIIILVTFVLAFLVSPESFGQWWEHLGAFGLMFAVTFIMFIVNMVGGGDTKLASALALWVGLKGLMAYLFYMALVGGLLGILSIILRKKKPFKNPLEGSWVAQVQAGKSAVPYGIAIGVGAWASLLHTDFLRHQIDEVFKIIL